MRKSLLAHAQCRARSWLGDGDDGSAGRGRIGTCREARRRAARGSYAKEPVVFYRDVRAVMVPAGAEVTLKTGQAGYITQALGGSFTVYVDGNLLRIAGEDADALGKEVIQQPEHPP